MDVTPNAGQQIGYVLLWWFLLEGTGWLVLPLAFRLFRRLPDRGYALAKPLGLVAVNYLLWMSSTLGFLRNTWGNILLAAVGVGVFSWLFYRHRPHVQESEGDAGLWAWLNEHWRTVLVSELVFSLAFALWALYKAYDPNIAITEKPMEFAFLNAIVRSNRFPPYDPWMSGYSISYYYFGYVMVATLSKLSGVATRYAFNLGIATLFALTASGAFSAVYNMVSVAARSAGKPKVCRAALGYGVLAALMIPLMGNLEGALEFAHANGAGITVEEPGNVTGPFWEWVDVKNLTRAPVSETWYPTDGWWWWRASRVIHDKGLTGNDMEVIDEFPAFSFLLGDMHPHVLAYPFVFMVIGLAFNVLLSGTEGTSPTTGGEWWVIALCLGAIGFLNTWDLPFYFFLMVAAYALNLYWHAGMRASADAGEGAAASGHAPTLLERLLARWGVLEAGQANWLGKAAFRALELGVVSVLLYLPYWLYSRPQAGSGILPNLFNVSRFVQLFLMFGTFLVVLAVFLMVLWRELWRAGRVTGGVLLRQGLPLWLGTMLFFPLLLAFVLVPLLLSPAARSYIDDALASPEVQDFLGPQTLGSLLRISLRIRAGLLPAQLREIRMPAGPWTFFFISLLLAAVVFWFVRTAFPRWFKSKPGELGPALPAPAVQFALLLALVGLLLIFGVEFVYLRDGFGTRMNTVFKFYFQAWALLGLTAAFGLYYVLEHSSGSRLGRAAFAGVFVVLLAAGMLYPLGASINRTGGFAGPANLDGLAFVARDRPDELAAIEWLNEHAGGEPGAPPVIVEAVRGSFAYEYARFSSRTGLPAVMGWTGHEGTWHGLYEEIGERERDVQLLYAGSLQDAERILDKYDVSYVIVGYLELSEFPDARRKFDRLMDVAFQEGNTTVYERR